MKVKAVIDNMLKMDTWLCGRTLVKYAMVFLISIIVSLVLMKCAVKETRWIAGLICLIAFFMFFIGSNNKKMFLLSALIVGFSIQTSMFLWTPPPLLHPHGAGPVGAPEVYAFDLPLLLLTGIMTFTKNKNRSRTFLVSDGIALIVMTLFSLSLVNTQNVLLGITGMAVMARMPLVYYCLSRGVTSQKELETVIRLFLIMLFIQSSIGIGQAFGVSIPGIYFLAQTAVQVFGQQVGTMVFNRPFGTIGYTTIYAQYLELLFPMALVFYFFEPRRGKQGMYAMLSLLAMLSIVFTLSRILWINLVVIVLFLLILFQILKLPAMGIVQKHKMTLVVIGMIVLAAVFSTRIAGRASLPDNGSANARIQMSRVAIRIITHKPLVGIGINNYTHRMYEYGLAKELPGEISGVHNAFLYIAAETGLLGLLAILSMWMVAIQRLIVSMRHPNTNLKKIAIGLLCGLIALFIHSNVEMGFHVHQQINGMLWSFFGITAALHVIVKDDRGDWGKHGA
jgi:O-antigen ligase